jgi:F-box protein 21
MKENPYLSVLGSYSNVMNSFPHAFLTTNKQTLPISLVHIFTAIATRMGLNASPINFPGTVLAHVLPRHEAAAPIIVNASHPTNTILNSQIYNAAHLPGIAPPFHPCTGLPMLMRASRNIISSLMTIHDVRPSILHPSLLLSLCVHFLFQADDDILNRLLADAYLQAWDCIFLLDRLAPSLLSRCRGMIRSHCQTVLDAEAAAELNIHSRTNIPVKYFVGMAFVHARYNYVGFIYGWDVSPSLFCYAWLLTSRSRLSAKRPKTGWRL